MEGIHYPLYVVKPSEVNITAEQFHHLSIIGLQCFLISWPIVFEKVEDEVDDYIMYGREDKMHFLFTHPRFTGISFFQYEDVEMMKAHIPHYHAVRKIIDKYFQKLILK